MFRVGKQDFGTIPKVNLNAITYLIWPPRRVITGMPANRTVIFNPRAKSGFIIGYVHVPLARSASVESQAESACCVLQLAVDRTQVTWFYAKIFLEHI